MAVAAHRVNSRGTSRMIGEERRRFAKADRLSVGLEAAVVLVGARCRCREPSRLEAETRGSVEGFPPGNRERRECLRSKGCSKDTTILVRPEDRQRTRNRGGVGKGKGKGTGRERALALVRIRGQECRRGPRGV